MSETATGRAPWVNAVVLAGRRNEGVFREVSEVANEALLPIAGRPMLSYVLDAVCGAQQVGRVVVVGTPEIEPVLPEGVALVEAGDELIANVERGIAALEQSVPVAIVTSDIPLVTPAIIDGFVAECGRRPADLHYPAIAKELVEAAFPGVKRTYAKLREGTYTGGNIFLVHPRIVAATIGKLKSFVDARKSPAKMAGLLGPGFVVKMAMGALSAYEVEVKVGRMFGIRGVVVFTEYPEIGVDVDKLSDLELVGRVLAR